VENVRVYRTFDGTAIAAARDRLANTFAGRPPDDDITFVVSGDGGRIWFEDNSVLWQTSNPALLPQIGTAAEMAARVFIGRINSAVQNDKALVSAGINRLFPDDIRPSVIAIAADPDRSVVDHWLVRFDSYLPTDTSMGSVPVFGAITELRVGENGTVGACWLTWRPCYPQGLTPLIPLPTSIATLSNSSSDSPAPSLVYRLADEGVSQPYIAPYFFVQQDDDGDFFPASLYSPAISMVGDGSSEGIRLVAQVVGGSGQYDYRWAGADSTAAWSEMADLGTGDTINLDPGVYNIVLRVTDRITGIITFIERSVYTDMFVQADS
jgi:hypothetical protein